MILLVPGRGRRARRGWPRGCRSSRGTPSATRPGTAPAPCPAVAAVAATVAGVVALGIANASDAARVGGDVPRRSCADRDGHPRRSSSPTSTGTRYEEPSRREAPDVGVTAVTSLRRLPGRHLHRPPGQRPERRGLRQLLLDSCGRLVRHRLLVGDEDCSTLADPGDEERPRAAARDAASGRRGRRSPTEPRRGRPRSGSAARSTRRRCRAAVSASSRCELPAYFLQVRGSGAGPGRVPPPARSTRLGLDGRDRRPAARRARPEQPGGGRPARGRCRALERQRLPLRRARLPERRRDPDHPAGILFGARRRADARRHPHRDLPGAVRRATGPGHALGRRRRAADPARRRRVVRPRRRLRRRAARARRSASSPGSRSPTRSPSTSWAAGGLDARGDALPSHFLDVPWTLILGLVVVAAPPHRRASSGSPPVAAAAGGPARLRNKQA